MLPDTFAAGIRLYGGIGKYEVRARIAAGGMATVYRAVDREQGREVALKVLSPEMAARPAVLERFRREARQAARLRHENIVAVHEFGQHQGLYYLAMEFVDGTDLFEYTLARGPLEPAEARLLITQGCRALAHAHALGVVHRDVKPSNFLLARKDGAPLVKLTDMGLARDADGDEFRVTKAGTTVGTLDYMAPEQARDSGLTDTRSDLYSLGSTWFHLLAGHGPFAEGGLGERLYRLLHEEPPDVRELNPLVPAEDAAVLGRLLAKEREDRYQTAGELLRELIALPGRASSPAVPVASAALADATPCPQVRRIFLGSLSDVETVHNHVAPDTDCAAPAADLPAEDEAPEAETAADDAVEGEVPPSPAAGLFDRARQALSRDAYDYALALLGQCCRLEPGNVLYREVRRVAARGRGRQGRLAGWLAWLGLKRALRAGRDRDVLERGEEVLMSYPRHCGTQLDMARAAERLGETALAVWLLRQAHWDHPRSRRLNDALARLSGKRATPKSGVIRGR